MELHEKLKASRKEKGLTQIELAEKLGLGVQSVYRYETGERVPKVNVLEKYAKFFEKPMSYFTEEVSEEESKTNQTIAVMAIKAQNNAEFAEIIEKLNGMTAKQFYLTSLFVNALTDDLED